MNRTELVDTLSDAADVTKAQADAVLAALQDTFIKALAAGETVKLPGFLTVERVERAARTGRNPRTGEEIQIPAGYGVKIGAGSTLKKAVQS